MLKLMKYELRKSRFSMMVMVIALAIAELLFLYGLYFTNPEKSPVMVFGILLLIIVTVVSLTFVGLESLLTLNRELNTKQSYMLFMTPKSGYQILGAKVLENAVALFICSVFFLILAMIDISLLLTRFGTVKDFFLLIQEMLNLDIDWVVVSNIAFVSFCEGVISWFAMIITGYFAIILAASVLAGRKFSVLVAFIFYLILVMIQSRIVYAVSRLFESRLDVLGNFVVYGAVTAILAIAIYFLSSYILEKKLSV